MNENNLRNEISKVARELYEKSGRIEGRDLENWLEAEKIVMERYSAELKNKEQPKTPEKDYPENERRRHKRFLIKRINKDIKSKSDTKLINISIGGVAIETTKNLEIDKEYRLKVYYKGNPLSLRCRVIWASLMHSENKESGDIVPVYRVGMNFLESSLFN